ncbi:hypothetical protein EUTSA_v10018249mg [Eutrema salsugineum]|uniref:J domain-containing protein n=1 Tax=Eutrema salsugineum TaxID=72664 RepID=V4M9A4_EUTSA|nr:DNAJ protein JJJ1 homolog [Eutrema salsugineum]ESQ27731.1 hypothetical protein EUTSA_v10018249mg [Eutrema salsugineum]
MASSSRSEKRCLYEVLGISKESSPDEIRSSYRRLALQRHPDKLIKAGGISEAEATAQFQELVHAYEVLSDPKERAWYDSHRSQILFADHGSDGGSKSRGMPGGSVPDLFAFFSTTVYSGYSDTGKGFYKVYFDVFNSVYLNEIKFARTLGLRMDSVREAPIMGNLESPYAQVTAFYNYWLGFSTVMDFCWVDEYDAMAGPNRKSRRLMEEENKKVRKKAKREYNETVRGLAEFVKKRDKRVIDMMVKKNAEMELKKAEERERKKKMEKERLERAMKYEEPDWAKAQDVEEELDVVEEDDDDDDAAKRKNEQLYCIVCSKKFKSEKQWKNHEQSKKHKEKVAELRESFHAEDEKEREDEEENDGTLEPPETVEEELHEKFQDGLNIDDEEDVEEKEEVAGEADETDEEYFVAEEYVKESSESEDEDVDDEMALLKKMVSGQKNKRKNVVSRKEDGAQVKIESDTAEFSEFDNQKSTGRNRKGKKERNKRNAGKDTTDDASEVQIPGDDGNADDNVDATETASGAFEDSQKDEPDLMEYDNRKSTGRRRRSKKPKDKNNLGGLMEKSSEADDTKDRNGDMEESHSETFEDRSEYIEHKKAPRSKKSTRGMKTKGTSKKTSNNECDRCGEEFESRTKLFKHIADTGHATVKSR